MILDIAVIVFVVVLRTRDVAGMVRVVLALTFALDRIVAVCVFRTREIAVIV